VWVAKPGAPPDHLRILVASDLSPVSETCLDLALQIARLTPSTVHLLHVVDYPLDHIWSTTGLPDAREQAYRASVRLRASQALHAQLERAGATSVNVQVHLMDDSGSLPDEAVLDFLRTHAIDLLVMGSVGRSGLSGALIGNTAERILPELSCSLLALKPAEFVSPVHL
jgi:universal stress protein E